MTKTIHAITAAPATEPMATPTWETLALPVEPTPSGGEMSSLSSRSALLIRPLPVCTEDSGAVVCAASGRDVLADEMMDWVVSTVNGPPTDDDDDDTGTDVDADADNDVGADADA